MEMLLYQSTQFRDVKKILDRAHGFAGLLTAGGIEASRLDVPFVCDQKVLSRYDDACGDVRRILAMQLGLELPKGFSIPLEAEDLAVFFSQQCSLRRWQDYLAAKAPANAGGYCRLAARAPVGYPSGHGGAGCGAEFCL